VLSVLLAHTRVPLPMLKFSLYEFAAVPSSILWCTIGIALRKR
jgi:hypothetical protein